MSANETMNVSSTGGQKAGNDERYDLIPPEPLRRLAIHAGRRTNRCGSYAKMLAHAWKFWEGQETDPAAPTWPNLIAAAWEAFCLIDPPKASTPGSFIDGRAGAERYDLIPADALRQLARHFGVGARKYDADNWRRGYDWRLTFAAAMRHAEQWRAGEQFDPETGSNHLVAFAWHMLVLDEFTRIHPEFDTRTATRIRRWLEAEGRHKTNRYLHTISKLADSVASVTVTCQAEYIRQVHGRGLTTAPDYSEGQWSDRYGWHWRYASALGVWQYRRPGKDRWRSGLMPNEARAPYTQIVMARTDDGAQ